MARKGIVEQTVELYQEEVAKSSKEKVHSNIRWLIFVLWLVASIILSFGTSMHYMKTANIGIISQMFIIIFIVITVCIIKNFKRTKKFNKFSFLVLLIPYIWIMFILLNVVDEYYWLSYKETQDLYTVIIKMVYGAFVLVGASLSIGELIRHLVDSKKDYVMIEGIVESLTPDVPGSDSAHYAPLIKYIYKDSYKTYQATEYLLSGYPKVGDKVFIKVNQDNPSDVEYEEKVLNKKLVISGIGIAIVGLILVFIG